MRYLQLGFFASKNARYAATQICLGEILMRTTLRKKSGCGPGGNCFYLMQGFPKNPKEYCDTYIVDELEKKIFYIDPSGEMSPFMMSPEDYDKVVRRLSKIGEPVFFSSKDISALQLEKKTEMRSATPTGQPERITEPTTKNEPTKTTPPLQPIEERTAVSFTIPAGQTLKPITKDEPKKTIPPQRNFSHLLGFLFIYCLFFITFQWSNLWSKLIQQEKEILDQFPPIDPAELYKLLVHVVRGEQDQAKAILQSNPLYLLSRGEVTDDAGRHFTNITIFEYARWAMDSHMYRMMLACIPQSELGSKIREVLLKQCLAVEKYTIKYELEGRQINESHFDFDPLLNALETYLKNCKDKSAWAAIGEAQRRLPVHVVNEYCYPSRSFHPTPNFLEKDLPRSISIPGFFPDTTTEWWDRNNHTTVEFGTVSRGSGHWWSLWDGTQNLLRRENHFLPVPAEVISVDLSAMRALRDARTADLKKLRGILKEGVSQELPRLYDDPCKP
jgi:hypothetical protein